MRMWHDQSISKMGAGDHHRHLFADYRWRRWCAPRIPGWAARTGRPATANPIPPSPTRNCWNATLPEGFNADDFHISTAWIEYINRLTGTVIGLLVMGTLFFAWKDHRRNRRILWPVIAAFITVVLNGWLGSQVVESELDPTVVTIHLLLAWVQVSLLLFADCLRLFPGAWTARWRAGAGTQTPGRAAR